MFTLQVINFKQPKSLWNSSIFSLKKHYKERYPPSNKSRLTTALFESLLTKYLNYFQTRTRKINFVPPLFEIQMTEEKNKPWKVRPSVPRKFCFWKGKKRRYTQDHEETNPQDTENFKLQNLSWEAWRQETKAEPSDVKAATSVHRRGALSEEMEKHIWFRGQSLREVRRYVATVEELKRYELL